MKNKSVKILFLIIMLFTLQAFPPFIAAASTDNITRQEALEIIMEALRSNTGLTNEQLMLKYGDVNNIRHFTDTTYEDVITARALGIVTGVTETAFCPNTPVTREQFAVMLMNQKAYIEMRAVADALHYADGDKIST